MAIVTPPFLLGCIWAVCNIEGIGNCFERDWCTPGAVVTNLGYAGGNGLPNYVRSNDNAGLNFNSGGVVTRGPYAGLLGTGGITFDANGDPVPFNVGSPSFALFQIGGDIIPAYIDANITVPVERYSVNAHFDYELAEGITAFIDGTYGHVDGQLLQTSFFNTAIPIFADNPFIPGAIRSTFGDPTPPTGPASRISPESSEAYFSMFAWNMAASLWPFCTWRHSK